MQLHTPKHSIIMPLVFLCNSIFFCAAAQKNNFYYNSNTGEQLGASLKLTAEIGDKKNPFNWRIGISAGAGAFLGHDWLYPSLNIDLTFYHGGIGSKWPGDKSGGKTDVEFNIAYTFTGGLQNRMYANSNLNPEIRNYPLYYYNTFHLPPLQNPFTWSLSWGGNAIFFLTRNETKFQQVGFINIHLDRAQIVYTNDGPPFFPPFGDRYDRLHTGSGFFSFHGNNNWAVNLVELGFNMFTGYSRNAYELSNKAGLIYIYYKDQEQHYYNKSHIYLNVGNTSQNWEVDMNFYNYPKMDIQHQIHQGLFYPLHMVPYEKYFSIGGTFLYNTTKIGLK